jgi:hypothetical protein
MRGDPTDRNTGFAVWAGPFFFLSLWLYPTDAPIEQVPIHWENRRLLSSQHTYGALVFYRLCRDFILFWWKQNRPTRN